MAKKKVNVHAQQKLQAAQYKKAFMLKLRDYCASIGGIAYFNMIPKYLLETIYENRGAAFKIRVAEDAKITKRFVKILYAHINEQLKSKTMDFLPELGEKITLFDYYLVVRPLERVLLSENVFFKGKEKFDDFCSSSSKRFSEYVQQIATIVYRACYTFCDLSKRYLYTFTYDLEPGSSSNEEDLREHQIVTIGVFPLDIRHVKIDGERRPVCQVGEIRYSQNISTFEPALVSSRRLRLPNSKLGDKTPIYIQQHAVDRIMTRAYCVYPGNVGSLVFKAFSRKYKIISTGNGKYLIECYIYDIKIGYFSAIYVDGILVIRTFLFITHSSTPEGKKLEQLTGLQKSDKAYLAIDDLRSLANSDIIQNDEVRNIFIEAGCKSIIDLCQHVKWGSYHWLLDEKTPSKELSKLILEYIQLGNKDEEYFINDDN